MLNKIVAVLTWGPPGSKRALVVVLGIASVILRHLDAALRELCSQGVDVVCSLQLAAWGANADAIAVWVNGLSGTLDFATLVVGVVALAGAFKRKK